MIKVDTQTLGAKIAASGRSQRQFALDVGMSQTTISQMCRGTVRPSAPLAKRIADALGVEWDMLFEYVGGERNDA